MDVNTEKMKMYHLNLGNDKRNIVQLIWPMEGSVSNLAALDSTACGRDWLSRWGICHTHPLLPRTG